MESPIRTQLIRERLLHSGDHILQTAAVRDLLWLCTSPSLVRQPDPLENFSVNLNDDVVIWFRDLDQNPAPLLHTIQSAPRLRLGHYAEILLAYFLANAPGYRLLTKGEQVRSGRDTVGEVDFIYTHDQSPLPIHLEMAVKFYISTGEETGLGGFIGPNRIDRLAKKYQRLVEKQAHILDDPAALPLREQHAPSGHIKEILLTGMLFYPLKQTPSPEPLLNPEHLHGGWCRLNELSRVLQGSLQVAVLERMQWLGGDGLLDWMEPHRVILTLEKILESPPRRPVMLALIDGNGAPAPKRLFVVPNDWGGQS